MAAYETKAVDPGAVFAAAAKKAFGLGGVLLGLIRFPHPGDPHLYQALVDLSQAEMPADGGKYVVWMYNASDNAFYSGHYHEFDADARERAFVDFTRTYVDRVRNAFGRARL